MRLTIYLAAALALAAVAPAAAFAGNYPPPGDPGGVRDPNPGRQTLQVCKDDCRYRTIQSAVNAAGRGDTIRVQPGTYREGVTISGSRRDDLKVIGNPRNARQVVIDATGKQNGVIVNGADNVTLNGLTTRRYRGNGFFVVNVDGYLLTNLVAHNGGVYGIYAFNSKGGTMSRSEAYYNNDAGFYIGQTPPQTRPKRSIIERVKAWGNVLGYSGTNSRYVTIRNSEWYNNGVGLVPNVLDSEKFPPAEENVITGNRIFWNNFNYFPGAPFPLRRGATGDIAYPVGTGILLFGSKKTIVENNQIFGNYLVGAGLIQQVLLNGSSNPRIKEAAQVRNNTFRNNQFGLGGRDLNGRDLFYDGSGSGNCFAGNAMRSPTVPADGSTFSTCPFTGANPFNQSAQNEAIQWTVGDPSHEANWIKHPHSRQGNLRPLERFRR